MSAKILKACHAMSLEDERDAFTPVIWDERYVRAKARRCRKTDKTDWLFDIDYDPRSEAAKRAEPPPHQRTQLPAIDQKRISQVWFVGVHADVGGGYPQNGLAYVTFDWMLDRAEAVRAELSHRATSHRDRSPDRPDDKLNDSRKGLGGLLSLQAAQSEGSLRGSAVQAIVSRRSRLHSAAAAQAPLRRRHEFSTSCIPGPAERGASAAETDHSRLRFQARTTWHGSLRACDHAQG